MDKLYLVVDILKYIRVRYINLIKLNLWIVYMRILYKKSEENISN